MQTREGTNIIKDNYMRSIYIPLKCNSKMYILSQKVAPKQTHFYKQPSTKFKVVTTQTHFHKQSVNAHPVKLEIQSQIKFSSISSRDFDSRF